MKTNVMTTTNIKTRFMQGNKTSDVFDILADFYGMTEIVHNEIDFEECVFSDGFILAMESDLIPVLDSHHLSSETKKNTEWHHFIFKNECYVIYFQDA